MPHRVARASGVWNKFSLVGLGLLSVGQLPAQSQSPAPLEFEVASVKQSNPNGDGWIGVGGCLAPEPTRGPCHGRFTARAANVKMLIEYAFRLRRIDVSGGPDWTRSGPDFETRDVLYMRPPSPIVLSDDRYDVEGRAGGDPSDSQIRLMLQRLLAERFQLSVHRESRDLPVFELVVAKNGAKLKDATECGASEDGCGAIKRTMSSAGFYETARHVSMVSFIDWLSGLPEYLGMGRPVLDRTGLSGAYDFTLEYSPGPNYNGPSLFTAAQEQLGLKLESTKRPVEVLVIDHVEKPSEN